MVPYKFIISALRLTIQSSASRTRFHNKSWRNTQKFLHFKPVLPDQGYTRNRGEKYTKLLTLQSSASRPRLHKNSWRNTQKFLHFKAVLPEKGSTRNSGEIHINFDTSKQCFPTKVPQ
jgi:hypothetical protein